MSDAQRDVRHGVVRAVGSIGLATLLSRILGFVRDMVVARAFGAGPVTDAFFVAFRIPNLLRRLLAEGALSTAFIPVFTSSLTQDGRAGFRRMLRAVAGATAVALCAVSVLGMLAAPWIVRVMAPGWTSDPGQIGLAADLTRFMFPYLVLVGLASLGMAALNAHHRFFTAALGPAVLNVAMILAVLVLAVRMTPPILALAVGVLVGGAGQFLVQLPELRRLGVPLWPSVEWRHPAVRAIAGRLWPAVFALAAVQVTVLVNTLLASLLPQGTVSYLYYADRVMEFPLGIFGIALASASLPVMARQAAAGETRALTETLGFSLRLALYASLPAMIGLVILRTPIVRVLFERGKFGPAETGATADALAWYAIGLVGFAGSRIAAQVFYALGQSGTAVRLGIVAVGANVLAALLMMGPLGHAGLAGASSVGAYVNLLALLYVARRRLGPFGGRALAASAARTLAASIPLIGWCALVLALWPASRSLPVNIVWLGGAIAGGVALYWGASVVLGLSERTALLRMFPRAEPREGVGA